MTNGGQENEGNSAVNYRNGSGLDAGNAVPFGGTAYTFGFSNDDYRGIKMYILLHDYEDELLSEICINVDKIITLKGRKDYQNRPDGTYIHFDNGACTLVLENYDNVLELLQTVLQQGRFRGVKK